MSDFTIGQGDTQPALVAVLSDATGPYSLAGATVSFHMTNRGTGVVAVSAAATPDSDQVVHKGRVSYSWQVGDTALAGDYLGEFRVLIGGISPVTFPNTPNKITITVTKALI